MKWILALFTLFLVGVILAADFGLGGSIFSFFHRIPGADKAGHFILIGLLALLVNLYVGLTKDTYNLNMAFKVSLAIIVVVTLEEISQIWFRNRSFSISDLVADFAGIVVFGLLAILIAQRLKRTNPDPS